MRASPLQTHPIGGGTVRLCPRPTALSGRCIFTSPRDILFSTRLLSLRTTYGRVRVPCERLINVYKFRMCTFTKLRDRRISTTADHVLKFTVVAS